MTVVPIKADAWTVQPPPRTQHRASPDKGLSVRVEQLHKSFDAVPVLNGLSLDIAPGDRLVLFGPSGSGKSSLIRCIAGLEPYAAGRIRIGDVDLPHHAAPVARLRGEIGMVFQGFHLFPHLTVLENCALAPRRVLGLSRSEAEDRARDQLARVRVLDHAGKRPAQLSGGQQQRVAIARAMCMQPRLMLFDEPTSALDPETIREVLDSIAEVAASGMTLICVTHELCFARRVADRAVFIDHGEIIEQGAPSDLLDAPRSERLRAFLDRILPIN